MPIEVVLVIGDYERAGQDRYGKQWRAMIPK